MSAFVRSGSLPEGAGSAAALVDEPTHRVKRETVAVSAKPRDHGIDRRAHKRGAAKWLAGVHIGEVEFDLRGVDGFEGVMKGDRRVCVGARIDNDRRALLAGSCTQSMRTPS